MEKPQLSRKRARRSLAAPREQDAVSSEMRGAENGSGILAMAEAIALLKTTRPTFYRWLRSGRLRGMKVGRQWRFYRDDIERFLRGQGPKIELPGDLTPLVRTLTDRLEQTGHAPHLSGDSPPDVTAVSLMMALVFYLRGSDIHLEPMQKRSGVPAVALVRCRIDGVLHTVAECDLRLLPALIDRWKTMAGMDLNERRKPQDGRLLAKIGGRELDLRVSVIPVCYGESLTARLLDAAAVNLTLDRIEYADADRERLLRFLASSWGLLIVTGPTGSGKTTVLYSCVNHCAKPGIKTVSVEDPVEYLLPWVNQIPVRPNLGLSFAAGLRAILRQDPDVILIGEVRDNETLSVAQQCALTGHLVMTALHAEDAASALRRMVDMGSDPFIVADATKLVISQRLVRKLCRDCSREVQPTAEALARAKALARTGGLDWRPLARQFRAPVGCVHCRGTGFRGRTTIGEALQVSAEIGSALRRGATADELRAIAVGQGMTTLAADGIRRAAAGITSLDEVFRCLGAR